MKDVYVIGIGQIPVNSIPQPRIAAMGAEVVRSALLDAHLEAHSVDALFVGNMLSGTLSQQQQLGSLIADYAGLEGIEAYSIDGACASGSAAIRMGYARIAGGIDDVVVACGVEAMTHAPNEVVTRALASATDWELEGSRGESFVSLNATLMRAYRERYSVGAEAFAPFSINAHRNALTNPNALLRKEVDTDRYLSSRMIADPLRLFDISPICNGAAAVVLASGDVIRSMYRNGSPRIRILASTAATDSPAVSRRANPLHFPAVEKSTRAALTDSGLAHADIDFFELHDAYTIMTVLSLESGGFAAPGTGTRFGTEQRIGADGSLPLSTMGGLKARGHPVGATGVYQFAEAYRQLAGAAGANQVHDAEHALLQNIGGVASTVVTHVLRRES
jgi:acetyl-CoA C-acetyltransferase